MNIPTNTLNRACCLVESRRPIVLIRNEGRPSLVSELEPLADGVVTIYLPCNYGGDAFANILSGDVNPRGKLPFTYPKSVHSLITYDHKPCENLEKMEGAYDYDAITSVQWGFGYGLSYTTFAYENLQVSKKEFGPEDELTFRIDVKNTGDRTGKESVLLFIGDEVASLTPDVRRLRGFDKTELAAGETKTVTFAVNASELAFVGADGKWILEPGKFNVQIGDQITSIECMKEKRWSTPNRD